MYKYKYLQSLDDHVSFDDDNTLCQKELYDAFIYEERSMVTMFFVKATSMMTTSQVVQ